MGRRRVLGFGLDKVNVWMLKLGLDYGFGRR